MKTLSYGASTAAFRWAAAHDLDDVLWVSTDGYALEGPTSSLVWCDGDILCTVPAARTGILPSVTTSWLLAHAAELGLRGEERMVTPAELAGAAGVWLLSSVRGPAEVTSPRRRRTAPLPAHPGAAEPARLPCLNAQPATRSRRAERCGESRWPIAAISWA